MNRSMNASVVRVVLMQTRSCVDARAQGPKRACAYRIHRDDMGEGVR
ncbi:hypothetical protein XOCgx_4190 [Xanthomonas oryzae pv. oryzicola]|nr:hypothetical protein XOCgx_4190 [Xanthomonas oryzae pv. oryzicola]